MISVTYLSIYVTLLWNILKKTFCLHIIVRLPIFLLSSIYFIPLHTHRISTGYPSKRWRYDGHLMDM